jgi:PTS system nitrogen regulatory IIA component
MPFRSLSLDETAVYLHLPSKMVEQYVRSGEIPHEMRGNRPVFLRAELDAWASQRILGMNERRLREYHAGGVQRLGLAGDEEALMPVLIQEEYINADLAAKTRRSVMDEMVDLAAETGRVNDPDELRASVHAREDQYPTALPGGLALLHCRNHLEYRFEGSFLMLGRSVQGIPFSAPDGRNTRFFFLLCSQEETLHLHTLARLCLMAQTTDLMNRLHFSAGRDAMYVSIIESEAAALMGRKHLPIDPGNRE